MVMQQEKAKPLLMKTQNTFKHQLRGYVDEAKQ
jgi:hypothetical protein